MLAVYEAVVPTNIASSRCSVIRAQRDKQRAKKKTLERKRGNEQLEEATTSTKNWFQNLPKIDSKLFVYNFQFI